MFRKEGFLVVVSVFIKLCIRYRFVFSVCRLFRFYIRRLELYFVLASRLGFLRRRFGFCGFVLRCGFITSFNVLFVLILVRSFRFEIFLEGVVFCFVSLAIEVYVEVFRGFVRGVVVFGFG